MTDEDVADVIHAVRKVIGHYWTAEERVPAVAGDRFEHRHV